MRRLVRTLAVAISLLLVLPLAFAVRALPPDHSGVRSANQVFVKIILPIEPTVPPQGQPVVESWVAEQLKQMGESKFCAVTEWVPVSDDDTVASNMIWDGRLKGARNYCPVDGDIPERKEGRIKIIASGWAPVPGYEAHLTLADEPGSRAVGAVQLFEGRERKPVKVEERLPYVAVLIGPPLQEGVASSGDKPKAEPGDAADSR